MDEEEKLNEPLSRTITDLYQLASLSRVGFPTSALMATDPEDNKVSEQKQKGVSSSFTQVPSSEGSEDEGDSSDIEEKRVGAPQQPPQTFTRTQLEMLDTNLFLARKEFLWKPSADGVVYGGQVIGQSLAAATKTVAPLKILHSMHCYFLVGGSTASNIVYTVLPLRDGASFSSRLVVAQQRSKPIFIMISSFQKTEFSSLSHQALMPKVSAPQHCLGSVEYYDFLAKYDPRCPESYRAGFLQRMERELQSPIETRFVLVSDFLKHFGLFNRATALDALKAKHKNSEKSEHERELELKSVEETLQIFPEYTNENKRLVWIKAKQRLPDDDWDMHRAVLAYASDMFLLASAITGKYNLPQVGMIASRDHSMWFHSAFRMDEWMLYELESPRAESSRGLSFGRIFRQDGVLAVSVSQEGLIRLRQDMRQFSGPKKTSTTHKEGGKRGKL